MIVSGCAPITFIVSSRERSSEGSSSGRLPVWDLLQVYQGVWQRLPVHMEHLTPVSVLTRPAQDQCQLEEEDVEPLKSSIKVSSVYLQEITHLY